MKVILQKDVKNLGDAGDIKEVADGYARNFLLPKKLVILAKESSKKIIDHQKKIIKLKKEKRKKQAEKFADELKALTLKIPVQVGEDGKLFGSVTSMDIAKKLHENGIDIDKRKIVLDAPIKHSGEYEIQIRLHEGFSAKVKVVVDKE